MFYFLVHFGIFGIFLILLFKCFTSGIFKVWCISGILILRFYFKLYIWYSFGITCRFLGYIWYSFGTSCIFVYI